MTEDSSITVLPYDLSKETESWERCKEFRIKFSAKPEIQVVLHKLAILNGFRLLMLLLASNKPKTEPFQRQGNSGFR